MLDEILTPQERAVVARAKAFAEEHVAPNAARWEWERRYPLETIKAACAIGLNTIELAKGISVAVRAVTNPFSQCSMPSAVTTIRDSFHWPNGFATERSNGVTEYSAPLLCF